MMLIIGEAILIAAFIVQVWWFVFARKAHRQIMALAR